ncbi:hypothetical protein C8R44DRAFT_973763 [Mycena epipterygia]|nr:hypothetical protein C8R44DRAFT_973763 [Mycena epipterygia]
MSNSTTSAYRIQYLLGKENYATWAVKMTDILTDQGLIEYVSGAIPRPQHTFNASGDIYDPQGTQAQAIQNWDRKDLNHSTTAFPRYRYTASATLIYSNNMWVENQALEAQMWMQQGADGNFLDIGDENFEPTAEWAPTSAPETTQAWPA